MTSGLWRFAIAVGCVLLASAAQAERRVALVIGNSAYEKAPRLRNPENDSRLIAESLGKLGFAVTERRDLTQKEMRRAVTAFAAAVRGSRDETVALFYYAGHGLQVQNVNYLVPVDASIASESDVVVEAVRLNDVLEAINEAQPQTTVVILDACRDNPFGRGFRSMTRGLAEVKAGPGSLIAYSTAPGDVAADGDGRNSPYSAALASAMAKPGLDIEHVFKSVRISVYESTNGRQTPWESSSLTRDFRFAAIDRSDASPAPTPQSTTPPRADPNGSAEAEAERAYWEAVALNTPEAYEALLRRFPSHRRRDAIDKLLTRAYDQRMWDSVRAQDTILGYEQYKIAFPDGIYAEDASRRIAALRQATNVRPVPPVRHATPREDPTSAIPKFPDTEPSATSYHYVTGLDPNGFNWLALRRAPSFQAPWSPTKMGPGTLLSVIGRQGEWLHVRLRSGETGWANAKFVACCRNGEDRPRAPAKPAAASYHYVTGLDPNGHNWLALRQAPSFRSGWSDTRMGPGTLLTVTGREGEWLRVRLRSGETGWAHSKFVSCCRGGD